MAMLQIGSVAFTPVGPHFSELEHRLKGDWLRLKRFGRRDALQFGGLGEEPVTISGVIYPEHFAGFSALAALRAMIPSPQMLVSGSGDVFGLFSILEVGTKQSLHDETGAPRKVAFDLKLDRYGEDGIESAASGLVGSQPGLATTLGALDRASIGTGFAGVDLGPIGGSVGLAFAAGARAMSPAGSLGLDSGSLAAAGARVAVAAAAARLW